jgi:hypothetical protein
VKDLDINKVFFQIRKSTPKLYDRLSIYKQRNGTYKITITSYDGLEFKEYGEQAIDCFCAFINHEFQHIILMEVIGLGNKDGYDFFLQSFKRYTNEKLKEDFI